MNRPIAGIASNISSGHLKKLVVSGILAKADAVGGQRARYRLIEAGAQMLSIIFVLCNWGLDWRVGTSELRAQDAARRSDDSERLAWKSRGAPLTNEGAASPDY